MQGMNWDNYGYVYFISFDLLIPFKNVWADHRPDVALITKCANEHAAMDSQYWLNQNNGLLQFNLMRVEICELRPEVVTEGNEVLVHYQSRTNVMIVIF